MVRGSKSSTYIVVGIVGDGNGRFAILVKDGSGFAVGGGIDIHLLRNVDDHDGHFAATQYRKFHGFLDESSFPFLVSDLDVSSWEGEYTHRSFLVVFHAYHGYFLATHFIEILRGQLHHYVGSGRMERCFIPILVWGWWRMSEP